MPRVVVWRNRSSAKRSASSGGHRRLSITEVKEYTPVEEKTRLEKIGEGFVKSLKDLGSGILDFFTWLLIDLPYLLVFGLVVFLAVKLLKAIRKKRKAKKQKKEASE